MADQAHSASARFPTTAWSQIAAAQDPGHPDCVAAMNCLIGSYWKPIFYYLRAAGHPVERAEDLTQAFFLQILVKQHWLSPADPERGRFRAFLLTLLKRFAHDQTVRAKAQVQFERHFVSVHSLMQEQDRAYDPPARETPEEAFQKQWKAEVRATVRRSLEEHYRGAGKPQEWQRYQIFAAYWFVADRAAQPAHEALAARFGVSVDQVRYALQMVRNRYERLFRQELRAHVSTEAEIDEEIRELL